MRVSIVEYLANKWIKWYETRLYICKNKNESHLQCRYSQMIHLKLVIILQCAPSDVATSNIGCHYDQCFIHKVYIRLFIVWCDFKPETCITVAHLPIITMFNKKYSFQDTKSRNNHKKPEGWYAFILLAILSVCIMQRYVVQYMLSLSVHSSFCPSACLSPAGTVLKWLNIGSHRQCCMIAQGLMPWISERFQQVPAGAPNRGGVGYNRRFSTNISLYLRNSSR